jgi:hypothetical protein
MSTLLVLLALPSAADTLQAPLGTQTGALFTPGGMTVELSLKGSTATESATWQNVESDALSFRCATEPTPPPNEVYDQLVVQVGDKKWALAPGSAVAFSCGEGKTVTVTDLHGRVIAAFKKSLTMKVEKAAKDGAR